MMDGVKRFEGSLFWFVGLGLRWYGLWVGENTFVLSFGMTVCFGREDCDRCIGEASEGGRRFLISDFGG